MAVWHRKEIIETDRFIRKISWTCRSGRLHKILFRANDHKRAYFTFQPQTWNILAAPDVSFYHFSFFPFFRWSRTFTDIGFRFPQRAYPRYSRWKKDCKTVLLSGRKWDLPGDCPTRGILCLGEAHKGLCGNSQFIKWLLTLTRYLLLRVRHHGKHCAEQHSHVFSYKERTMLLELAKTVRSVYRTRVQKIFPYKTVAI